MKSETKGGGSVFGSLLMAKPVRDPSFLRAQMPSAALDGLRKCSKNDCKKVGNKCSQEPRTHFGRSGPLPGTPLFAPCRRRKVPKRVPKISLNCLVFTHTRFQIIKRLRLAFQTGFSSSAFGAIMLVAPIDQFQLSPFVTKR